MGSNSNTIYDIIILGAGVSGIGMAHSLLKKKDQTFLILEKNDGVGGTWRNKHTQDCVVMFHHIFIPIHFQ